MISLVLLVGFVVYGESVWEKGGESDSMSITAGIYKSWMKRLFLCLTVMQYNELVDKVTSSETKVSEMETTVEDLQWDIEKLRKREQKLNKHLAEAMEQVWYFMWNSN